MYMHAYTLHTFIHRHIYYMIRRVRGIQFSVNWITFQLHTLTLHALIMHYVAAAEAEECYLGAGSEKQWPQRFAMAARYHWGSGKSSMQALGRVAQGLLHCLCFTWRYPYTGVILSWLRLLASGLLCAGGVKKWHKHGRESGLLCVCPIHFT